MQISPLIGATNHTCITYRTSSLSRLYTTNFVTHKFNGYFYFSSYGWKALVDRASSMRFLDHKHTTPGRNPLDVIGPSQRPLPTTNTHT